MLDPQDPAPPGAALPPLQSHAMHSRRARPPNPDSAAGQADRVPLKGEARGKLGRRESRLGLRSIFGRQKATSDADKDTVSPRDASQRPGGIRASLVDISHWPYGLHNTQGHRSEVSLPSFSKSTPTGPSLKHKKSESGVQAQAAPDGLAAWSPPPLFQAYPQAVKHAHLPACTASPDVILRMHNHRSSGSLGSLLNQSSVTSEFSEEATGGSGEWTKRRHRKHASGSTSKFEWTSKVYILVTSGYLLQYAGEGSYDRLPERVLQLGKDSAAFASDAIPGRHWVLQVSSAAEPDRTPSSHSSLRARLPFRAQGRHSSTFLMVFESAEEMGSWITILRREIETLGGRKVLSETGKPNAGGQDPQLRSQGSQRTLVVRDPNRFSRIMTPDQLRHGSPTMSSPDIHLELAREDTTRTQSFDDASSASVISHDGRQLDGLRDSTGTNCLSFISSGSRTVVTSAGSSPPCSPVRTSFAEQEQLPLELPQFQDQTKPRLRPNAMAISDRRQSLQTMNHVLQLRVASAQSLRPRSTCSSSGQPEEAIPLAPALQLSPNSSVPQGSSKRYSFTRTTPSVTTTMSAPTSPGRSSSRRPPPSALSINPRPLSLVEDQPSPDLSPGRAVNKTESSRSLLAMTPTTPPAYSSKSRKVEGEEPGSGSQDQSSPGSNMSLEEKALGVVAQIGQRPSTEPLDDGWQDHSICARPGARLLDAHDFPRSRSSLGTYEGGQPPAQTAGKQGMRVRRLSFSSQQQVERAIAFDSPRLLNPGYLPRRARSPPLKPAPRSSQHLRADSLTQGLPQRRSMSQLIEGPPPAPPPKKALPPIPRKASRRNVVPPPGFI
ncbi:hypothetical protein VTK56DRAFT_4115 [Thermocarpiscus australiensis]